VPPATSIADANKWFDARAAAAIYSASAADFTSATGDDYGVAILARWAFQDYFDGPNGSSLRSATLASLASQQPGKTGSYSNDENYDFLLNFYIPLLYIYYKDLPDWVREYIINVLLTVRGPLTVNESEVQGTPFSYPVPETENHLFQIETARYLTNQILYQRTHDPQYDNRRNGQRLLDVLPTAVWLLNSLQAILQHDFAEYNARPYQDQIMKALLNLQSYAYDHDVRLAARMALDYISAKVAVSSNDLRRAPPFRRRNEYPNWGPFVPGSRYLRSPVFIPREYPDDLPGIKFEPDLQGTWYAMLAGNTGMLPNMRAPGTGRGSFSLAMVSAGIHDYRVPDLILDLFVSQRHRRFYQQFQHWHFDRDVGPYTEVDESYAGSPSYLITAGGHPTSYCYQTRTPGGPQGQSADLGSAMPTTFMPTGIGLTLDSMIQFGLYTTLDDDTPPVKTHMGVALDFACGDVVFRTADMDNAPPEDRHGPWIFLDRGHPGQEIPGYYLALYDGSVFGDHVALLEAFDTWLNPVLSFDQFKSAVLGLYGSTRFSATATNTYVTRSGQVIQFTISPISGIAYTGFDGEFAYGDIMQSAQGSGVITIQNPRLGPGSIILDMHDAFNPTRTELGVVERGGVQAHEEVWVDFNSPAFVPSGPDGDFYHPFKTLAEAVAVVTDGGTIKIMPGTTAETLIQSNKRVNLVAPIGGVNIGGR
jgi:hypothetical protein